MKNEGGKKRRAPKKKPEEETKTQDIPKAKPKPTAKQ
jgi:hypothetical protein